MRMRQLGDLVVATQIDHGNQTHRIGGRVNGFVIGSVDRASAAGLEILPTDRPEVGQGGDGCHRLVLHAPGVAPPRGGCSRLAHHRDVLTPRRVPRSVRGRPDRRPLTDAPARTPPRSSPHDAAGRRSSSGCPAGPGATATRARSRRRIAHRPAAPARSGVRRTTGRSVGVGPQAVDDRDHPVTPIPGLPVGQRPEPRPEDGQRGRHCLGRIRAGETPDQMGFSRHAHAVSDRRPSRPG